MKTRLITLFAVSTITLSLGACAPERNISSKPPGSYESTETSTDDKGTTTVRKSTSEVTVDEYGNKKEMITSKITKDPKGLMNKTTTKKTSQTTEQK